MGSYSEEVETITFQEMCGDDIFEDSCGCVEPIEEPKKKIERKKNEKTSTRNIRTN